MRLLLVGVCLVGCHHATPDTTLANDHRVRHLLGAKLTVSASWQATCTDWSASFDAAFSKSGSQGGVTEPCHGKPFGVELTCSTRCDVQGDAEGIGSTHLDVVPRELGPLTITATSRRRDSAAVHAVTLPAVLVVLPDRLELRCSRAEHESLLPCGPEGVPASRPQLAPVAYVGDTAEATTALRVNGAPVPTDRPLSLVELYPQARVGDGIAPGTYTVEVAVGAVTARWQVVAR